MLLLFKTTGHGILTGTNMKRGGLSDGSKSKKRKKSLISGGENEATDVGKSTTPKKGLEEIGLWKGRFWFEVRKRGGRNI